MAFPVSPTNGQTAVVNNITYQFSNVGNTWTRILSTANVITANTIISNGVISAVGNVSGNYILGNGALLTGVITSVANINNGTSNVTVVSSGGNVTVGVGGTGNVAVFATTGEYITGVLSASGNITGGNLLTAGAISATGTLSVTGNATLSTTSTGNLSAGNVTTGGIVSATANITGGNILTSGLISVTGNVSGGNINLSGNIVDTGALSIITGSNGNLALAPNGTGIVTVSSALSATGNVTTSGNINLSGTGARITGDFSNATIASRTMFQTSTANSFTAVMSMPSGTGVSSGFTAFSGSDPGNAGLIQIAMISASEARLSSAITGTGTYANLTFFTGGSQRFGIDTNGNVTANVLLSVTGNVTGGNLSTTGNVTAANVVVGSTITGAVGALVVTASQGSPIHIRNSVGTSYTEIGLYSNANVIVGAVGVANPGTSVYANTGYFWSSNGLILNGNGAADTNRNIFITTGGIVTVPGTTAASNTTTGAMTVSGGVGVAGNIYAGGLVSVTGNIQGGNIRTAGLITATGNIQGGNLLTAGLVSATGNISGNFFIGNGAFLTGLSAGSASNIANGSTNITIPVSSGNIAMSVAGQSNTVVINLGSFTMYGTFAGPKTLSANVTVADSVNALLLGPVSIGGAYHIDVPDSSTLYVYAP